MFASETTYDDAWRYAGKHIIIPENRPRKPLRWWTRRKLKSAIRTLEKYSDASTHWMLGKIEQRIGNYYSSLSHFIRANEGRPKDLDIVTSAIVASLDTGAWHSVDATVYSRSNRRQSAMPPFARRCNRTSTSFGLALNHALQLSDVGCR